VSAVATARGVRVNPRARAFTDQLLAAVPVLTVFFWLALIYCWESWGHATPWLFTDELETAQLSRAIADTGHAARRGDPHSFQSLYNYLIAPAWWLSDMNRAYATVKYIGAVTMTTAIFPAYWLARTFLSKPWALFAGAATAAVPALVYSSFLVYEPLAYPYATLCFFLIAKALAKRDFSFALPRAIGSAFVSVLTRRDEEPATARRPRRLSIKRPSWVLAAIVACAIAPLVRGQLVAIPAVLVAAAALRWWGSERMSEWRKDWTVGDWVGWATLVVGVLVVVNAFVTHRSFAWYVATTLWKGRMLDYGLWAAGALTIGLGVFPVVAGLAALVPLKGVEASEEERAFRCAAIAGIALVGFYTAVKAAYISTVFSTLVEERNLIYITPLLMIGTAFVLERAAVRLVPALASAGLVLYLILTTPYHIDEHFYFDAPGFGILESANQNWRWTAGYAQNVLIGLLIVSLVVLVLPRVLSWSPRAVVAVTAAAGAAVFAWTLTAQITAAISSKYFSELYASNIAKPYDWLDHATNGKPTIYLGQNITDPTGIQELEFWNRSIRWMWSLDGSAIKVGSPVLTPDLGKTTGRLIPAPKGAEYVVSDEGTNIVGKVVAKHEHLVGGTTVNWQVTKIYPPLRLQQAATGIYDDGWTGPTSTYSQFATPGNKPGYAVVILSRVAWGGIDVPGHATIKVGRLVVRKGQPVLGRVTDVARYTIHSHGYQVFHLRTPPPPFRVTVFIDPTFVPHDLDPRNSDVRAFGAQVSFGFQAAPPPKPAKKK
jgi:hypothetical protein